MAVLIEAFSVITRRDQIEACYPGGLDGFLRDCPNQTACTDTHLVRVGFLSPEHVQQFITEITRHGLVFCDAEGRSQDIVVIDQFAGPTTPCDWAEAVTATLKGVRVSACRMTGTKESTLSCPAGWDPEKAMGRSLVFVPPEEQNDRMEFLREENGLLVCRDRVTGKLMYSTAHLRDESARDKPPPDTEDIPARNTGGIWRVLTTLFRWN